MIKKTLLSFAFIFSLLNFSYGQSWYPLSSGITGDYGISTEAVYNGNLYAGGWFYQAGDVPANNIAQWNGSSWSAVGSGLTGGENNVDVMCVYNGKLYVGGAFYAAQGLAANDIAVWDGSNWDTAGSGLTYCSGGLGWADAMAVYNGKLYVAGAFCHAGGIKANNIACWDGTKWDSVSSGINDSVYALAVYNGNLYAGGQFTRAGRNTVSNIAYWNGSTWNTVASGTNGPVLALAQYNGALYAGGEFTTAGGNTAHFIASWNGTAWAAVGGGVSGTTGVEAFCVFNGLLYTGGLFNKAGSLTTNNIATWNGTVWDTVSTKGINSTVEAIAVLDSALYAGGQFSTAGKVDVSDIAAWGGKVLGVDKLTGKVINLTVYPNPNKGQFTISSKEGSISNSPIRVEVYNVLGERIYNSTLRQAQGDITVNVGAQPEGVYLYRLLNESENIVYQGKIIIQ
jgi:hypothetical protein